MWIKINSNLFNMDQLHKVCVETIVAGVQYTLEAHAAGGGITKIENLNLLQVDCILDYVGGSVNYVDLTDKISDLAT